LLPNGVLGEEAHKHRQLTDCASEVHPPESAQGAVLDSNQMTIFERIEHRLRPFALLGLGDVVMQMCEVVGRVPIQILYLASSEHLICSFTRVVFELLIRFTMSICLY
jgi:hypothetical protein